MRRVFAAAALSCLLAAPAAAAPRPYHHLLTCSGVEVGTFDDAPWDKEILPGMSMRAKRLDNGGAAAEHVSYVRSLDVGASSYLQMDLDRRAPKNRWKVWQSRLHGFIRGTILIDDHADGTVDQAYRVNLPFSRKESIFDEFAVPLLREAGPRQTSLAHLYAAAGARSSYVTTTPVTPELQRLHEQSVDRLHDLLECPDYRQASLGR